MVSRVAHEAPAIRQDGFGTRRIEWDLRAGRVERLAVSRALATPSSEQAIRARAAHLNRLGPGPVGRVLQIERKASALTIVSPAPDGVTLSDVLAALEFGTLTLSDDEVLELAASVVRGAARVHEVLGSLAHGALTPAHVVLMRDGSAVFTGAVFGDAIQSLQRNREGIWRDFSLALPAAASVPRFDQRGDVTQLSAVVLAIVLRRSLRRDEFPRGIGDLVMTTSVASTLDANSTLHMWLQDGFQMHGRVVFDSAVDAAEAFEALLPDDCGEGAEALALRTAILQMCVESSSGATAARGADAWSARPWTRASGGVSSAAARHAAPRS